MFFQIISSSNHKWLKYKFVYNCIYKSMVHYYAHMMLYNCHIPSSFIVSYLWVQFKMAGCGVKLFGSGVQLNYNFKISFFYSLS